MSTRAKIELGDGYGGSKTDDQGMPRLSAGWAPDARQIEQNARALIADLRNAQEAERAAKARVENIVQELRTMGASWSVIAAAVGTTRAAAHKRFARRELTN